MESLWQQMILLTYANIALHYLSHYYKLSAHVQYVCVDPVSMMTPFDKWADRSVAGLLTGFDLIPTMVIYTG